MAEIDLTGLQINQPIDLGPTEKFATLGEEDTLPLPTLEEVTTHQGYQDLDVHQKALVLGDYRNEVANYLNETGVRGPEFDSEIEIINSALKEEVDKFSAIKVFGSALTRDPLTPMKEELAGLGATVAKTLGMNIKPESFGEEQLNLIRETLSRGDRQLDIQDIKKLPSGQKQFAPAIMNNILRRSGGNTELAAQSLNDIYSSVREANIQRTIEHEEVAAKFEDIRAKAQEEIAADPKAQGLNIIREFSDNVSAVNIGTAINQLGVDIAASATLESVPVVGKGLGASYFAVTSAARSDKAQRILQEQGIIDPRSSAEQLARSMTVGTFAGLLERAGVGFLTKGERAQRLGRGITQFAASKGVNKGLATAAGRITGAAIGEATTELGQAWVETFGNEMEGFDEFLEMISDSDRWADTSAQAALGFIVGGMARGSMETASAGINQLVKTESYQKALQGKSADIAQLIVNAQKQRDEAKAAGEKVAGFDDHLLERVPISELSDPAAAIEKLITGQQRTIDKREILSKEGAAEQGEVHPIRPLIEDQINRLLENEAYVRDRNITNQQTFIGSIVNDGTWNQLEQQIDELTGGDPNVDKEGIIFKAVNRAFNIPDADVDVQPDAAVQPDAQVEVPGAPQALREDLDAGMQQYSLMHK